MKLSLSLPHMHPLLVLHLRKKIYRYSCLVLGEREEESAAMYLSNFQNCQMCERTSVNMYCFYD